MKIRFRPLLDATYRLLVQETRSPVSYRSHLTQAELWGRIRARCEEKRVAFGFVPIEYEYKKEYLFKVKDERLLITPKIRIMSVFNGDRGMPHFRGQVQAEPQGATLTGAIELRYPRDITYPRFSLVAALLLLVPFLFILFVDRRLAHMPFMVVDLLLPVFLIGIPALQFQLLRSAIDRYERARSVLAAFLTELATPQGDIMD